MQGDRDISDSLISAVREGKLERVEELISNFGLSHSQEWSDGYVLLCDTLENKRTEVAKLLITSDSKVNSKNANCSKIPLYFAIRNGDVEIVEMLLDKGTSTDVKNYGYTTPLLDAVRNGYTNDAERQLEHRANVDAESDLHSETMLHMAVGGGHSVIVKHILKHCPDVNNKSNRSALNVAIRGYGNHYPKIVEKLLQYGFMVNFEYENNCKLLHDTVEKGYLKIVEQLLKYGTDVNTLYDSTCREGSTPLHVATKNKWEEEAKLLISFGADVNAGDIIGATPICYAVENDCKEIAEVLLEHGADVNSSDKNGRTALHFTALTGPETNRVFFLNHVIF